MSQIKPHTLSGFMELLPQPQLQMEAIMEVLRTTYSLYGFTPLDTPARRLVCVWMPPMLRRLRIISTRFAMLTE